MADITNGGPAFPYGTRRYDGGNHYVGTEYAQGMSLRDWFAGQALAGLMAHPKCGMVGPGFEDRNNCAAREAYALADALLAERSKAGGE